MVESWFGRFEERKNNDLQAVSGVVSLERGNSMKEMEAKIVWFDGQRDCGGLFLCKCIEIRSFQRSCQARKYSKICTVL